jgi:hypothetical protein
LCNICIRASWHCTCTVCWKRLYYRQIFSLFFLNELYHYLLALCAKCKIVLLIIMNDKCPCTSLIQQASLPYPPIRYEMCLSAIVLIRNAQTDFFSHYLYSSWERLSLDSCTICHFIISQGTCENFFSSKHGYVIVSTDSGMEILDNCLENVKLCSTLLNLQEDRLHVRELDWNEPWPPSLGSNDLSQTRCKFN